METLESFLFWSCKENQSCRFWDGERHASQLYSWNNGRLMVARRRRIPSDAAFGFVPVGRRRERWKKEDNWAIFDKQLLDIRRRKERRYCIYEINILTKRRPRLQDYSMLMVKMTPASIHCDARRQLPPTGPWWDSHRQQTQRVTVCQ